MNYPHRILNGDKQAELWPVLPRPKNYSDSIAMSASNKTSTLVRLPLRLLLLTIGIFLFGYISKYLIQIFLIDQFVTPTESMMPTLLPGDRIIIDKTIMGARIYSEFNFDPIGIELNSWRTRGRRGVRPNDIVVFNFPHHDGKINFVINNVYAKRCIGIPGDSVSINDGFFRNSNFSGRIGMLKVQEDFRKMPDSIFPPQIFATLPWDRHLTWTIKNFGPLYLPRKGDLIRMTAKEGCVYRMILEWETGKPISYDWEKDEVYSDNKRLITHKFRHGYYFFCGDNVCNSNDSRYWGIVPEDYIVGVVTRISYSIDPSTGRNRTDRILKKPI